MRRKERDNALLTFAEMDLSKLHELAKERALELIDKHPITGQDQCKKDPQLKLLKIVIEFKR